MTTNHPYRTPGEQEKPINVRVLEMLRKMSGYIARRTPDPYQYEPYAHEVKLQQECLDLADEFETSLSPLIEVKPKITLDKVEHSILLYLLDAIETEHTKVKDLIGLASKRQTASHEFIIALNELSNLNEKDLLAKCREIRKDLL